MSKKFRNNGWVSGVGGVLTLSAVFLAAGVAYGATLGDVAKNATTSIKTITSSLEYVCLMFSGGFGIGGLLKAYQHYNQPHSVKSSTIMAMLVVAACFGSFTYFLETQSGTLFGSGAGKGARIPHR